jgi:hypothetical protein
MKKNKYDFSDLLQEKVRDYLTEEDFYPPSDDRHLESYVKDINGGDNFADYCEYIFEILDEEEYFD